MRATLVEFRQRFYIIGACFCIAFFISRVQRESVWISLSAWLSTIDHLSTGANALVVGIFVSLCVVVAALLRTWGAAYLHSTVVHDPALRTEKIVAVGPFRYLRNPLYLGTILLALGTAPMLSGWGALFLLATIIIFSLRLIGREESEMARTHGSSYDEYCRRVPSLVPRLASASTSRPAAPEWPQAIVGELWFWGFAAATVCYAFTFRFDWYGRIILGGFGLYLIGRGLLRTNQGLA